VRADDALTVRRVTSPIITLTTDFGSRDGYAAAMKGVILGIHPGATIVDVTHDVPPQDVAHAAFVLGTTCPYFPPDAVHVAVVDPGVGTKRNLLLLVTPHGSYVAPDNGVVAYILMAQGALAKPTTEPMAAEAMLAPVRIDVPSGCDAYLLNRSEYWLGPVSDTFHGRDIFAPVAAHLASGVPAKELGEPMDSVVCLSIPQPLAMGDVIEGHVIHVDRFGNLVSNIRLEDSAKVGITVEIDGATIHGLSSSYAAGEEPALSLPKGLLAIVGSSGYLEVAARNASAAQQLGSVVGSRVRVKTVDA
jgi:S-adenosylmethionine hydrolase